MGWEPLGITGEEGLSFCCKTQLRHFRHAGLDIEAGHTQCPPSATEKNALQRLLHLVAVRSSSSPDRVGLEAKRGEMKTIQTLIVKAAEPGGTIRPNERLGIKAPLQVAELPKLMQGLIVDGHRFIHIEP